jgi:hypothetical protein
MSHARTQIRNAVTALLTGNTSAGSHVYESRIYPLENPKLPALLVYTKQEVVADQSMSQPRTQLRQLQLTVEAYVKASSNADETADTLALEVEQLIAADPTLGGLAKDSMLTSTDIQFSDEGEKPIAIAVLTYTVHYAVKEHQPQTII